MGSVNVLRTALFSTFPMALKTERTSQGLGDSGEIWSFNFCQSEQFIMQLTSEFGGTYRLKTSKLKNTSKSVILWSEEE